MSVKSGKVSVFLCWKINTREKKFVKLFRKLIRNYTFEFKLANKVL